MWKTMFRIYLRIAFSCLLIVTNISDIILGLRDVSVTIPSAVRRGENALLICNYDMENDTLYTVKWYKGRREFYRYTPKEVPAMKTFSTPGINVEQNLSNQSHIVLQSVQLNLSGKFACEISADAPEFHTLIASGTMVVVELPEQRPIITSIHSRYRLGDTINGNCSSDSSKPAANLTWTINDNPLLPNQIRPYKVQKNPIDNLETSVLEVNFIVNHMHFIRGRLKLKCTANIFTIYEQESEKSIEEDRPRILASGRSPDMNLYPFDQQVDGDFPDQNELYSTHYKETSAASSVILLHTYRSDSSNHANNRHLSIFKKILICFSKLYFLPFCIKIILFSFLLKHINKIPSLFSYKQFNSDIADNVQQQQHRNFNQHKLMARNSITRQKNIQIIS